MVTLVEAHAYRFWSHCYLSCYGFIWSTDYCRQQWFPTSDMTFDTKVKVKILRLVTPAEAHAYCFWSRYYLSCHGSIWSAPLLPSTVNSGFWLLIWPLYMTFDTKVKVNILRMVTLAEAHAYRFWSHYYLSCQDFIWTIPWLPQTVVSDHWYDLWYKGQGQNTWNLSKWLVMRTF